MSILSRTHAYLLKPRYVLLELALVSMLLASCLGSRKSTSILSEQDKKEQLLNTLIGNCEWKMVRIEDVMNAMADIGCDSRDENRAPYMEFEQDLCDIDPDDFKRRLNLETQKFKALQEEEVVDDCIKETMDSLVRTDGVDEDLRDLWFRNAGSHEVKDYIVWSGDPTYRFTNPPLFSNDSPPDLNFSPDATWFLGDPVSNEGEFRYSYNASPGDYVQEAAKVQAESANAIHIQWITITLDHDVHCPLTVTIMPIVSTPGTFSVNPSSYNYGTPSTSTLTVQTSHDAYIASQTLQSMFMSLKDNSLYPSGTELTINVSRSLQNGTHPGWTRILIPR